MSEPRINPPVTITQARTAATSKGCTCSNPSTWKESTCAEHGDEVRRVLAGMGIDTPDATESEA